MVWRCKDNKAGLKACLVGLQPFKEHYKLGLQYQVRSKRNTLLSPAESIASGREIQLPDGGQRGCREMTGRQVFIQTVQPKTGAK